ncbi:glutamate racemase [Ruoffia tabacinasalis]|jgi:glutamate racemase|uniref:Glutamate racemase n=1 Tax=Ruoffia tabacinasalis TaxID=87458 RepID=A0ABS0LIA0_9LACT|nr:glutamate racemase [Ruoffia tabacinasalis]MBG9977812.1 glutamate racemase [Ruoffia tabacinasalis]
MKELPIGFIDSGFGGLTVVKQSLKQLPNESIIYLGDSARAPYGPRSLQEVKRYIWQLTNFLREKGIKMLVIACNTGTAAALEEIRATLAIPVVGVIHSGCRTAIKNTTGGQVGVIGTQGTINSNMYEEVMLEKADSLNITSIACPEFVELVESQNIETDEAFDIINHRLEPLKEAKVDSLVLGCTHYPLLIDKIQKVMGQEVTLIDSGVETINEVSTLLDYFSLSRTAEEAALTPATQAIYTTGNASEFETFARQWLKQPELKVQECDIKGEIIVDRHDS